MGPIILHDPIDNDDNDGCFDGESLGKKKQQICQGQPAPMIAGTNRSFGLSHEQTKNPVPSGKQSQKTMQRSTIFNE